MIPGRILLVAPYTYPYNAGGSLNALNFGKYLAGKGFKVKLLSFNRNLQHKTTEIIDGVSIFRMPYFNKGLILKLLSSLFICPIYVFQILKYQQIIIYGGYILGWEFIAIVAKWMGRRVIFRSTLYGEDDIENLVSFNKFLVPVRRYAIQGIHSYFSLTPAFTEKFVNAGGLPDKIIETSQGVDPLLLSHSKSWNKSVLRNKLNLPVGSFIIISIGIVLPRKGYLRLFEELVKLDIPFIYVILGEYQLNHQHHLRQLSQEVTMVYERGKELLGNKIRFAGFVQNVEEFLCSSDIFLSGSMHEGLPNSLLEAMALGVPPVVKKVNQLENYLLFDNVNAKLFDNYRELNSCIQTLYKDVGLRNTISRLSRDTIAQAHTFDHVCKKLKLN